MTVYELNQAGYASLPKMTKAELEDAVDTLVNFLKDNDSNYYVMINNEINYYTLYTYSGNTHNYENMAREMIDVAKTLGKIKAIEKPDNNTYVEFWILCEDNICRMYPMFNYEKGVIEIE